MKTFEIMVEEDLYITTSAVSTKFFIQYKGRCLPDNEWTDFIFPILEEWKYNLLKVKESSNILFTLYFHDGPFWLEVFKDDEMNLKINCVNDRNIRKSEMVINCGYYEFLKSIYDSLKTFVKILYKNKVYMDGNQSIYNQSISSLKEIRDILKLSKIVNV